MSLFEVYSWVCCVLTSVLLILLLARFRYLAVKPSVVVLVAFHFMIQWAATVNAAYVEAYLPHPWPFLVLAHGFPLAGLGVTPFLGRRLARETWLRIVGGDTGPAGARTRATVFLLACIALLAVPFLLAVPIGQSGIYAILFNPGMAAQARADSLLLVPDPVVRYTYNFLVAAFAPVAGVLLSWSIAASVRRLRLGRALASVGILVALLALASLTGARFYPAGILLAIVVAWLLRRGLDARILAWAIPAGLAVIAIPVALTVLREGHVLTVDESALSLRTAIQHRLFFVPMQVGLWHAHYAQTSGFIGVAGIPKLASLLNVEPINVANLIARVYGQPATESELANASYVFSYYAYFGLPSILLSLAGLWLLDTALLVYRRLSATLLVPCVATVTVASLGFVSVDYTIGLVTNGFLPALAVCLLAQQAARIRIGRFKADVAAAAPPPSGS